MIETKKSSMIEHDASDGQIKPQSPLPELEEIESPWIEVRVKDSSSA